LEARKLIDYPKERNFTPEHIENLSLAHGGQPVSIDGVIYRSYCAAAKSLNIEDALVRYRVLSNKPKYSTWILL